MACPFDESQIVMLKGFIELCKAQPEIIQIPKLAFFKDYLISLGVTLPTATFGTTNFTASGDSNRTENQKPKTENVQQLSSDEETETESDVELDMEGVIQADSEDLSQVMGDISKEATDEEIDQSDEKRSEAMKAFSEQKFDEAIKLYSEAILLNPQSSLLFAKRGQVYLKMNKPNACIKDCTYALELNCDSAAAYKFRGRAYRLLGMFEEASHDLCESLKIDYDDQTNEWLTEVKPNAEKLRQHRLGAQRKTEEKEHNEKLRRLRKAQEARAKASAEAQSGAMGGGFPGGFPGGMTGGAPGGMPDGTPFNPQDLTNLLMDPDFMAAFQDPEVAAAFGDVSSNPANFAKYQNNPKVSAVIEKLQAKFKFGAKGGAGPFSSAEVPNFGGAPGANNKKSDDDDVGLD